MKNRNDKLKRSNKELKKDVHLYIKLSKKIEELTSSFIEFSKLIPLLPDHAKYQSTIESLLEENKDLANENDDLKDQLKDLKDKLKETINIKQSEFKKKMKQILRDEF